jgi:hypothetical protein
MHIFITKHKEHVSQFQYIHIEDYKIRIFEEMSQFVRPKVSKLPISHILMQLMPSNSNSQSNDISNLYAFFVFWLYHIEVFVTLQVNIFIFALAFSENHIMHA